MVVVVHAADIQDRDGAKLVLKHLKGRFARLRLIWADGGYAGKLVGWVRDLRRRGRLRLEVVKRSDDAKGFVVLPRRWVVERTFGWMGRSRRLSKDRDLIGHFADRLDLERLPPYAPMLNPVEPLWGWLKWGRLSNFAPKDAAEIERRVVAELAKVREDQAFLQNPFHASDLPLPRALLS